MTSKKITELQTLATPAGEDLVHLVDDPSGTPTNKKISLDQLLRNLPANTVVKKTLTVQGNTTITGSNTSISANVNITGKTILATTIVNSNGVVIANSLTPANSAISMSVGKFFYDSNYLYICTSTGVIKRVALSSF
jgi:hypothetical protein